MSRIDELLYGKHEPFIALFDGIGARVLENGLLIDETLNSRPSSCKVWAFYDIILAFLKESEVKNEILR